MSVNARAELDRPTHSAWVVLKQILEISRDFQTKGTSPKAMTHPHLDMTAFALPLGSCLNVPVKSASAHTFKLKVLSHFAMTPLSVVPAK